MIFGISFSLSDVTAYSDFSRFFSYLCTGSDNRTSTTMAGTVKDMSLIKQVLQLKQLGESNRGISRKLSINKETVNSYVKTMRANGWIINDLLRKEDPELERLFHAGSPAYSDPRMTDFLARLPYFREQLTNPKLHVTRQLLYEEYIKCYPNGYGKSQFYFQPELIKNIIRKAIQRAINCASDPICWENGKRGSIELCCLLLMCYGI